MDAEKLLKMADFMETLPPARFDFQAVAHCDMSTPCAMGAAVKRAAANPTDCGTIGCVVGHTPQVFPELVEYVLSDVSNGLKWLEVRMKDGTCPYPESRRYVAIAAVLFDITPRDAFRLFTPGTGAPQDGEQLVDATPKEVAARIRSYVAWVQAGRP